MPDGRTDFGEFYPGGGAVSPSYAVPSGVDVVARAKLAAMEAAIPDMSSEGDESLGDVKTVLAGVKTALE